MAYQTLRWTFVIVFAWATLQAGSPNSAHGDQLLLRNGKRLRATLIRIHPAGEFSFVADDKEHVIKSDEILRYGSLPVSPRFDQVILRDGSVLAIHVTSISNREVHFESRIWLNKSIPLSVVKGIVFVPPHSIEARQKLVDRIRNQRLSSDCRIELENGDEVSGTLSSQSETGRLSMAVKNLANSKESTDFEFQVLKNVVFRDPDAPMIESMNWKPTLEIGFSDGSILLGTLKELDRANDGLISIAISPKFELTCKRVSRGKGLWTRVEYARPVHSHIRWLGDERPFRIVESPNTHMKTRFDRSVTGSWLSTKYPDADQKIIRRYLSKGIGTHADSQIVFLRKESEGAPCFEHNSASTLRPIDWEMRGVVLSCWTLTTSGKRARKNSQSNRVNLLWKSPYLLAIAGRLA